MFYFVLFALSILIFVTYYVWNYIQTQPSPSSANYSVVSSTSSTTSSSSSSSSQVSSSSSTGESTITVSGEGNRIEARYKTSKETAMVQLTVSDATSWVSVSGSDLEGGVTLSSDNKKRKNNSFDERTCDDCFGCSEGSYFNCGQSNNRYLETDNSDWNCDTYIYYRLRKNQ